MRQRRSWGRWTASEEPGSASTPECEQNRPSQKHTHTHTSINEKRGSGSEPRSAINLAALQFFPRLLHSVIHDISRSINNSRNEPLFSLPSPHTAVLSPCTPPAQRTGSTPSLSWPAAIRPVHFSSGPPNPWRAPARPSCFAPAAAATTKGGVRRRLSRRRPGSRGTAADSSVLALGICEVQSPLRSTVHRGEGWATLDSEESRMWLNHRVVSPGSTQRVMEVITWRTQREMYHWLWLNQSEGSSVLMRIWW